jgi:uncharacterized protein (DUF2147 family)
MKVFKFSLLFFFVLSTALAVYLTAADKEADSVLGLWLNEKKTSKIEIFKKGDKYYGKLAWLKEPNNKEGKPKLDVHNPDEKLKTKPILGLEILKDFEYDGDLEWEDGTIYDPRDGETYSCSMEMSDDKKELEIRGYIGISLFGKTTTWTRAKK